MVSNLVNPLQFHRCGTGAESLRLEWARANRVNGWVALVDGWKGRTAMALEGVRGTNCHGSLGHDFGIEIRSSQSVESDFQ